MKTLRKIALKIKAWLASSACEHCGTHHPDSVCKEQDFHERIKPILRGFSGCLLALAIAFGARAQSNYTWHVGFIPSASVFTGPTNINMKPDGNVIILTTNIALPTSQWLFGGVFPGSTIQPGSSNYVATTNCAVSIPVSYSNSLFAGVLYTNFWNATSPPPFSSFGGVQPSGGNALAVSVAP